MELNKLIKIYDENTAEIEKLTFCNEYVKEQFLEEVKRTELKPYIPFNDEAWTKLQKYINKGIKRGDKLYNTVKRVYSYILEALKDNISHSINSIDSIIPTYGRNYTVTSYSLYFTIDKEEFYLKVPILQNLTVNDIFHDGYFSVEDARLALYKKVTAFMWKNVWNGTDLAVLDITEVI